MDAVATVDVAALVAVDADVSARRHPRQVRPHHVVHARTPQHLLRRSMQASHSPCACSPTGTPHWHLW